MTSLSHWYHRCIDGNNNNKSFFVESMSRGEWKTAMEEAKQDPVDAIQAIKVEGFLCSEKTNNTHNNNKAVVTKVTPMHFACANKAPIDFIEFLHQLNPSFVDTRDSTYKRLPLHVAFMTSASKDVILKLVELDPDSSHAKDILGRYPIHYACGNHGATMEEIDSLLNACPASIKAQDDQGWLPLHVACRFNMPIPVIQLLLEKYPQSIHTKTGKGTTPLLCARKTKNEQLIHLLQEMANNTLEQVELEQEETDNNKSNNNNNNVNNEKDVEQGETSVESSSGTTGDAHPPAPSAHHFFNLHLPHHGQGHGHEGGVDQSKFIDLSPLVERMHFTTSELGTRLSPMGGAPKVLKREDVAGVAFSPYSPYAADHQQQIPFLGNNKLDLDD